MTTVFPEGIDTGLATNPANDTPAADSHPPHHAGLGAAVVAIERLLGVKGQNLASSWLPRRRYGEKAHLQRQEVALVVPPNVGPSGVKPKVLAEVRGEAGILRYVWMALDNGGGGQTSIETTSRIRVYIDDEDTPVVDKLVGEFFGAAAAATVFHTPRFGRTYRSDYTGGWGNSGYRYMYAPFKGYMRVEWAVEENSQSPVSWTQVGYSSVAAGGEDPRHLQVETYNNAAAAMGTPFLLCDIEGSGQLEAIEVHLPDPSTLSSPAWLEGNLQIEVDGEIVWTSTGGEDWVNGGFYTIPVGGWPAGQSSIGAAPWAVLMYRHFLDDPVFFDSRIKVYLSLGQLGQNPPTGTTWLRGHVHVLLDGDGAMSYHKAAQTPDFSETFAAYSAADLPSPWTHPTGTKWQGGNGVAAFTDYTQSNRWALADNPLAGEDFWLQAKVRHRNATANPDTSIFLGFLQSDSALADCCAIDFRRVNNQHDWSISARDGYDFAGTVKMDEGVDLLDVWVEVAAKVIGDRVTVYWRKSGATIWQPVSTWTTLKSGTKIGLGQWVASAEVDDVQVFPLSLVTA